MRILLIGGRYGYGDPRRGEAYEYLNFIPALRHLGHEVELLESLFRGDFSNFIDLNRAVLKKVEDWRPDCVLHLQTRYEIWTETWDIISKSGIAATVNWAADDSWKYSQASRFIAKHFDACATTYRDKIANYRRDGYDRVMESQWAADASRSRPPISASECEYDVSFIGARYGSRSRFVKALERVGVKVDCFGHGWPNGVIPGEKISQIIRSSKITLNFSGSGAFFERFQPNRRQVKARVFEVPGAGGFLLSEWAPGIDESYDLGREIDVFRTEAELICKVKFYLAHLEMRDECAEASFRRTLSDHTYELRLSKLVEYALEQHKRRIQATSPIDWGAFEKAALLHTVNCVQASLRSILVKGCSTLFGRERGARAARRLLFELSWRVLGEKTYSSESIPGRLFYAES